MSGNDLYTFSLVAFSILFLLGVIYWFFHSKTFAVCLMGSAAIIYGGMNVSYRLSEKDGELYRALHLRMPGKSAYGIPEHVVSLADWSGTKSGEPPADEHPEVTAGKSLRRFAWYGPDYVIRARSDGHYELFRPAKTVPYWSLSSFVRIGPWKKAE